MKTLNQPALVLVRTTALIGLLFLNACSQAIRTSPLDPAAVVKGIRNDILTTGKLGPESTQIIRMAGIDQDIAIQNGGEFLSPMLSNVSSAPDAHNIPLKYIFAGSEIALARALELEGRDPHKVLGFFLRSGRLAYAGMLSEECAQNVSLLCDNFKVYYLRATLALLQQLQKRGWKGDSLGVITVNNDERYSLASRHDRPFEAPESYETITASALIGVEGLANRHIRYGIGLPLTACRGKNPHDPLDQYLPRVGTCLPLTAVLKFDDQQNDARSAGASTAIIQFHSALDVEEVTLAGRNLTMAANFTAPFASIIEKTGLGNFDGLFNAFSGNEKLLKHTGFYSVEPYDAGKIPLVTVHGLFSSPVTWLSLHNDLMGDPIIRKHFQVWHYLYPTNLPILENASTFRKKLDELETHLQSSSSGKGFGNMVIIAHSMGGLLTRTAVARHDQAVMDAFFSSPETLKELDEQTQSDLNDLIGFVRKPYINRVIFVAVPHRGSPVSESWVGWIGKTLISLPKGVFQRSARITSKLRNYLNPELQSSLDGQEPTSVKGLSPNSPGIKILAKVAIDNQVPFHSIIGNQGMHEPLEQTSDGVVFYTSSHLDGAQSEYIVPADHSAHTHPLAVQEVMRILYLHLKELHREGQESATKDDKTP